MNLKKYILSFVATLSLMDAVSQEQIKSQELQAVSIKSECKNIIGYFPSWEQYKRNGVFATDNVKYKLYTVINYAFFAPDTAGNLAGTDAWGDSILLRGRFDFAAVEQPAYIPNTSLIDLAHAWGVKVMVSIGGGPCQKIFQKLRLTQKRERTLHTSV